MLRFVSLRADGRLDGVSVEMPARVSMQAGLTLVALPARSLRRTPERAACLAFTLLPGVVFGLRRTRSPGGSA